MRHIAVLLAAVLLVAVASGCEKPSKEQCEDACWKAGELAFWAKKQEAIEAEKDPDERGVLREEAEEEWRELKGQAMNPELNRCVVTCQKDGRVKQIECIRGAETYDDVKECM